MRLWFVGVCMMLISGCMRWTFVQAEPDLSLVAELQQETVALVHFQDNDGEVVPPGTRKAIMHAYCGGVWVSAREILTAAHCTRGEPDLYIVVRDEWHQDDWVTLHGAREVYRDEKHDLTALRVAGVVPAHALVRVREGRIVPGEMVHAMGHPAGYVWSYAQGFVAAGRPHTPNTREDPVDSLQLEVPIIGGYSGCGAYDRAGRLVGIASWSLAGAPDMAFYVHASVIRGFLRNLSLD